MTAALVATIDFLRAAAVAPRLADAVKDADLLPQVTVREAGACAAQLAYHARKIAVQAQFATDQTQVQLRDGVAALALALMAELEAHGGAKLPHWRSR